MTDWEKVGAENGWTMPPTDSWKRLPLVRHLRAIAGFYAVNRWYTSGPGIIGIRTGYDEWVLHGIWHGYGAARK